MICEKYLVSLRVAVSIKQRLEKQQHIANVCREYGWTEPPVYDAMTEEYDW